MNKHNALLRKARLLQERINETKILYKELDKITQKLVDLKFKSNKKAVMIDNFDENTQWKQVAFKRFEIQFL